MSPHTSIGLTGATGASPAGRGLSIRAVCFTYEQRRSAASLDSVSNQEAKHRRLVSEPEKGGKREINWKRQNGEVGLLPHAQAQLGLRAWVQLDTRWGPSSSLAFLVMLASTTLPQGWPSVQLLAQHIAFALRLHGCIHDPKYPPIGDAHLVISSGSTLPEVIDFQPRAFIRKLTTCNSPRFSRAIC